ncbi:DUF2470 domain-containing protein [Frankia sp. AgKG'84/4]|uniref:DUF2470 domain-containing protein n=1 Tax=Frankia sp. AgKG'84/4 TaxID=573490 RepID=UPI00200FC9B2|nr:DUF2470 domain-containing protein [Frankia sp. AgKG'84/4]MCL9794343.1 DUF2470 domain-containing protein [Frankia sp. AgKG'84/4]
MKPLAHQEHMIEMAQRARTVLAGGRTALLTLPREQARGWMGVIDDGGEPMLLANSDGPVVQAARKGRRSWVDVPGHFGERLILAGPLRLVPGTTDQILRRLADLGRTVDTIDGMIDGLSVLAVSVDDVMLCYPSDCRPKKWSTSAVGRRIDLTAYALAEPDLISAYAPELIAHLNSRHADQMRHLASVGLPAEVATTDLAGAHVSGLDRRGLDLWRVTTQGAEQVRVVFEQPLTEPRSLGQELRRLLTQSGG